METHLAWKHSFESCDALAEVIMILSSIEQLQQHPYPSWVPCMSLYVVGITSTSKGPGDFSNWALSVQWLLCRWGWVDCSPCLV
jgi:hypothetical protein